MLKDNESVNMDSNIPQISVIIPAYNQAHFLSDAINSVLVQTYHNYEIIVVDDGSTDQSKKVIDAFAGQVRYIWQENKGLAGARNTGIKAALYDFVALLDADDVWLPSYLETIISLIIKHPEGTVYYSGAQCIDNEGKQLSQRVGFATMPITTMQVMYQALLQSNFLIPSTITLRRSVVSAAGYFDQSLRSCEDWDLWLRILPEYTFVGTNEVLVGYRVHDQSLSANVTGMNTAKKAVVEKHFGPDDGQYAAWSVDKKKAYAGLYRYCLLTLVRRKGEWESGNRYLQKCLSIDASKSLDVELFYELALGNQPMGLRGSSQRVNIESNANKVMNLLDDVLKVNCLETQSLKRQVYGTACYAIGLCAYNTDQLVLSRRYLELAGKYRPGLWFFPKLLSIWFKSWLGNRLLAKLRRRTYP